MERRDRLEFDDDVLLPFAEPHEIIPAMRNAWWIDFEYDRYDWNDPTFKKKNRGHESYRPIKLTQGYFMMVPVKAYRQMTTYPDGSPKKWHAIVHLYAETGEIESVYAKRHGREIYDEPRSVYAHRELLGIVQELGVVGDHVNGKGLDNRFINLKRVGSDVNNHNTTRPRADGLPIGVERTGKPGNYRYNGKVCARRSRKKVITIRSRKWKTPEPAAAWYQNYLKRKHKRTEWAHNPGSVFEPFFPPRWDSEPELSVKKTTRRTALAAQDITATF